MHRAMSKLFKAAMLRLHNVINSIADSMRAWTELTSHLIILLIADNIIKALLQFLLAKYNINC